MSIERFSTSDIYMFEHVNGFIECCGCLFSDWNGDEAFPQFKTPRKALEHLYAHMTVGHDIGNSIKNIEDEYPDLDIEIQPYVQDPEVLDRIREKIRAAYEQHPPRGFRDKGNGE